MIKNNYFDVKLRFAKVVFLCVVLVITLIALPYTYSRYESEADVDFVSTVAYYVLEADKITHNIKIDSLIPSDEPYVYQFSVANHDGENRLETRLEYDLTIRTTTNLPLEYELYLNEDHTDPGATDVIVSDDVVADEDGMYFREMTVARSYFNYAYDETNEYTLLIFFPLAYMSHEYQNILENIEIEIDSRQIIRDHLPVTDGLVLHLDAAAILGLNDNDLVEVWEDLSGLGNDATQPNAENRPIYRTNQMNGLPVIRHDGSNHFLIPDDDSLRINPEITIFTVINLESRTTGTGSIRVITSKETGHTNRNWWLVQWDNKWRFRQSDMGTSTIESDNDASLEPALVVVSGDGSDMRMFVDGTEQQSSVSYSNLATQNAPVGIGRQADATSRNWVGDIAEVIIYDQALSTSDREAIENYLGEKWLGWE